MTTRWTTLGLTLVLAAACGEQPGPTGVEEVTVPLYAMGGNKGGNGDVNLGTHLTGDEEFLAVAEGAPHPSDSPAQGQAIFRISEDGSTVDFRLIASNIHNVFQAHIHCAPKGTNGPIRMWLFPVIGPTGTALTPPGIVDQDGVLASGSFSPTGVVCPAVAATSTSPALPAISLLEAIRTGRTYVNVHTNDGVAPANTGPGDFPGGEIRGQIDEENR